MPIDTPSPDGVHGVVENESGITGVTFLYSVGETHFRVRLRPVTPLPEDETFEAADAWTAYEWSEVEEPAADAAAVEWFDVTHVPRAVRREFAPAVVQVPA